MPGLPLRLVEPMGKEAELSRRLPSGRIQCTACARLCQMGEGQVGLCGVRGVFDGKLYLLNYGKIVIGHVDPIEKKPVLHYRPGSKVFSLGTTGCNWLCRYCQNYDISQRRRVEGVDASPEEVVGMALSHGCEGVAYTYNEPTIFTEYARDVGKIARRKGLFNIFVSNGYGTPDTVTMMKEFLDCITVDFKGSGETGFVQKYVGITSAQPLFDTLLEIRDRTRIHIEITDLIVSRVGDNLAAAKKLSQWVRDNLGSDTPIHFLRFFPAYRMLDLPPTPIEILEEHYEVARGEGLKYVYIGNVVGHPAESTYCPRCSRLLIWRLGYQILQYSLDELNRCKSCGYQTPILGPLSTAFRSQRFIPIIG